MVYRDVLQQWIATLNACDLAYRLEHPEEGDRDELTRVFGESLVAAFDDAGYAGAIEVPWAAEELSVFALSDIATAQAGYRFDANTGQMSLAWDVGHYVISAWAGDPVTIDADGGIWFARHGEGTWRYQSLAPDLSGYINILCRWVDFFVGQRSCSVHNEDFSIGDDVREIVKTDVLESLPSEQKSNWLDFLFD
jgi:hypothetical protein